MKIIHLRTWVRIKKAADKLELFRMKLHVKHI